MRSFKTIISAGFLASALALAGCGGGGEGDTVDPPEMTEEQKAAMAAADALQDAVDAATMLASDADADADDVKMVSDLIMSARGMISSLPAAEQDDAMTALDNAQGVVDVQNARLANAEAQGELDAKERAEMEAAEEEMRKQMEAAAAAMAATAAKLYAGLEHGLGDASNVRTAASDADGVISVTIGTAAAVPLAEDKKTVVDAIEDWMGKRHTAEPTGEGGTYEAMVYSNVGEPMEGDPFNEEYTLLTTATATATVMVGEVGVDTTQTGVPARVDSPRFDQSAGRKQFKLGDNQARVIIPGTYHGVSGNYACTPNSGETCSATIVEGGFALAGGNWAFKPTDPNAKVMSVDDVMYASYGWWLHKSEDDMTYTASAFATARGTVTAAENIGTLRGTATYSGGAAGKYALYSSTGGTNDAGHFTAKATLEADFNADMVSGTISDFMGADGMARDWSVELKKSGVGDGGTITGADGSGNPMETVWTIDGTAAEAAGQWSGTLYDNGDDNVPRVATGTFDSEYSTSGKMVGAFGANVDN